MTLTTQKLTFQQYLTYSDGTDTRYELVNGELVAMGLGTGQHGEIIDFLYRQIDTEIGRTRRDWIVRPVAIGIRSPRAGQWETSRIPDLTVIPASQWRDLRKREAVIELNESPPILVIEVVSDSTKTTDYRAKRVEYNVLSIPEYWVVDPLASKVTIFTLVEELYESAEFTGNQTLVSSIFPELQLTVDRIILESNI
ncbi:MAG: Uma2 family endonuclease [Desertifilum sp.]|nr:Uma2 family endonuclease [Desertifilum sp.]